jgi:nicotinamide-nucleotide amidase
VSRIDELSAILGNTCREARWRVATAESCTGGGVAEAITRSPGSSQWFEGGVVAYANEAKISILGVRPETLAIHGAVSEAVAGEMARGALACTGADIAVGVTGIAGPSGGTGGKPVGLVWIAWARRGGGIDTLAERFEGDRGAVRSQAVQAALEGLVRLAREGRDVEDAGGA